MTDYVSWRKNDLEYKTTQIINLIAYHAPKTYSDASNVGDLFIKRKYKQLSWTGSSYETYTGFYLELARLIDIYLKVDKISQSTKDKLHSRLKDAWREMKNKNIDHKYEINYLMMTEAYINYNCNMLSSSLKKIASTSVNVFKILYIILNSDTYAIDFTLSIR